MNRSEAIAYLTKCADDNGNHWYQGRIWAMSNCPNDIASCPTCHGTNDASHLGTPGSRYGYRSGDVAPIAYRHAVWFARETGQELTTDILESSMSMAVNDHPDIESDLQRYAAELAGANIDAMVDGYLNCQLWAQLDGNHPSCDCHADDPYNACHNHTLDVNYSREDIADEYVDAVRQELAELVAAHPLAVRMYLNSVQRGTYSHGATRAGHFGDDFYLTREGHGAGFWDRGLGELGDYLTKISKWAGAADDLDDRGDGVLR